MKFPQLDKTPVKEIIFSVSYDEIIDLECFDKFSNVNLIKSTFPEATPMMDQGITLKGDKISFSSNSNGISLRNKNEIINIRKGSFSVHVLNTYKPFDYVNDLFIKYWKEFDRISKESLKVRDFFVRYINHIDLENEESASRLIQLYPKYSSDRYIERFQNSVSFNYKGFDQNLVRVSTTSISQNSILLDIMVSGYKDKSTIDYNVDGIFKPLQYLKNRAFFESITAQALLKYLKSES